MAILPEVFKTTDGHLLTVLPTELETPEGFPQGSFANAIEGPLHSPADRSEGAGRNGEDRPRKAIASRKLLHGT